MGFVRLGLLLASSCSYFSAVPDGTLICLWARYPAMNGWAIFNGILVRRILVLYLANLFSL